MSKQTKFWKTIATLITCYSLLVVAGGIGYGDFGGTFFGAIAWLVIVIGFNIYIGASREPSN
jgi:hypothetical protein